MNKAVNIEITKSGGNVFADLGLVNADECLLKAELAREINKLIKKLGLKQKAAAELLGIDQPKVSSLACGRLKGFSIERLLKFLIVLDQDIDVVIKPHRANRAKNHATHIQVRYAAA